MKEKNWRNPEISVGTLVKEKFIDMDDKTREKIISNMSEEVMGCVHDVTGKNKLLVQFKDWHKREIIYGLLSYVCSKE